MNAVSIGSAGLFAAASRFDASAQRMVSGKGDLAAEVVEQVTAKADVSASLAVIRTADDMTKRLLDILA